MWCRRLFAIWLAAAPLTAQDPPPPPGGFPLTERLDRALVYSDGYRVRFDVRHPTGTAPATGWPMVVYVGGLGDGKQLTAPVARDIARRGYLVATFDVRGQGDSMALNSLGYGFTFFGLRERVDLAELVEAVEAQFPAEADFDRLGIAGTSQGGIYAWLAAGHSGRRLPPNIWRTRPFPQFHCAVPQDFGFDVISALAPQGRAVHPQFLDLLLGSRPGVHIAPLLALGLRAFLQAEDYLALGYAISGGGINLPELLKTSTVPVACTMSYDDSWAAPNRVVSLMARRKPWQPFRLNLYTGGHGSPDNTHANDHAAALRDDWLDRHLKRRESVVDPTPPVRAATTPDVLGAYRASAALWDYWEGAALPAASAGRRYYLGAGNQLRWTAPTAASGASTVVHDVPAGLTIGTYAASLPTAAELMERIPLASVRYDAPPLAVDQHVLGTPRVRLEISTQDTRYQLHAALFDVDASGGERYVTGGFVTVRDNRAPGPYALDLALGTCSYVFRAGHRMRLRVENLAWHRPAAAAAQKLRAVPVFDSARFAVEHHAARPSWIDLPIEPRRAPRLLVSPASLNNRALEPVQLAIHADSAYAGKIGWLLLGASGSSPGFCGGEAHIPLNPDSLTIYSLLNPNVPPMVGFLGVLSPTGAMYPRLELPPGTALLGARLDLTFSALILQGRKPLVATNAANVRIRD